MASWDRFTAVPKYDNEGNRVYTPHVPSHGPTPDAHFAIFNSKNATWHRRYDLESAQECLNEQAMMNQFPVYLYQTIAVADEDGTRVRKGQKRRLDTCKEEE